MCISATVLAVASAITAGAGTIASMYATDTQAKQQEANQRYQAAQMAADAKAAEGEAQVEAKRIRDAAKAQRGQAVAAAAASGIDVNSPTALKIDETIAKNSEEDALLTIYNGRDRAQRMNAQSQLDVMGASVTRQNARMANAGTLINYFGTNVKTASNWLSAGEGGG